MAAALAGLRYRSARRFRQGPRIQGVWPAASIRLRPEPTMFCLILRFAKSRPVEESAVNKCSAYVPKAAFPFYGGQKPRHHGFSGACAGASNELLKFTAASVIYVHF